MQVDVHLYGILRDLLPPPARGRATVDLEAGASVADLLAQLGITRRVVVAVNDQPKVELAQMLKDGDRVVVYTMVGGG
jgi:thiamine biosynthesis protein ThiS